MSPRSAALRRVVLAGTVLAAPCLLRPLRASDPPWKFTIVVQEGQSVPGVGRVTHVDNLVVDSFGHTLVEVDTDQANTDTDSVLLLDGALHLREGDALLLPVGATIDSFDTVNRSDQGHSGWNFFLAGTSGTSDDSGLYFGTDLWIQEGDLATAPEFSAGTPWLGFFETKIDELDRVLVMASVDDPAVPSSVDRALVIVEPNGTQSVFLMEGDLAPGTPGYLVSDFGTGPHEFDFTTHGGILCFADTDGPAAEDGVIYHDSTVLAREGQPSPVLGRNWLTLSSSRLALNDQGDAVFTGSLDGDPASNLVLVRDATRLHQEGDTLPDIAPYHLTGFGTAPVAIADRGDPADTDPDVLWYGTWDQPDSTRDSGLFWNDTLLIEEGVTLVEGKRVESVSGVQDAFSLSPDGRYLLVELVLQGGVEAAVLCDRGPWNAEGGALGGTAGEPRLRASGTLEPGAALQFEVTHALPGTLGFVIVGLARWDVPLFGGTLVPSLDVLLRLPRTDAAGRLELDSITPAGAPAGLEFHAQCWFADPAGPKGFSASNGIRGVFP